MTGTVLWSTLLLAGSVGRVIVTVMAAILDLSPTTVEVIEHDLSPTVVGVIDLQDWGVGADMGFWQALLISALGPPQTIVGVTDPHN